MTLALKALRKSNPVGPFLSYYGAKYKFAYRYPKPRHHTIIEPFAGAASYSCHYPNHQVILIDKNPNVILAWHYLLQASQRDILSLPILKQGDTLDNYSQLSTAERTFLGWNLHSGGSIPGKTLTWFGGARNWNPVRRKRLAFWLPRIRHWSVRLGDYTDAPNISATWFIDPPYQGPAGRMYPYNNVDYDTLSTWCQSRLGLTIVCEGHTATWLPFRLLCKNTGTLREEQFKEALWIGVNNV
jgi:hypothetical protein